MAAKDHQRSQRGAAIKGTEPRISRIPRIRKTFQLSTPKAFGARVAKSLRRQDRKNCLRLCALAPLRSETGAIRCRNHRRFPTDPLHRASCRSRPRPYPASTDSIGPGFGPDGFGAFRHRTRHAIHAGGSGASNPGTTPGTGTVKPPAQTLRHAHRRRLLRFDGTISQGRSRAGRQRLSTQDVVSRFPPYSPPG